MNPILEIQNISKKYIINSNNVPYLSLRDSLTSLFFKKKTARKEFWALTDITFDIYPGESFGIIGKNGAGKSTLLKILSKITFPTKGKIISRGRIASLLEVGTGFHPELTGRENIFLNGSILGMTQKEIYRKLDEIVEFSGVEKFLNVPLKHFSSGMQLRLAFSVAAFLEPEILLIDEVLAVGDAEFQKKCIGKMDEVSKSGRTIIFVSHDLSSVNRLCKNAVFLQNGTIKKIGPANLVISDYILELNKNTSSSTDLSNVTQRNGQGNFSKLKSITIKNVNRQPSDSFRVGDDVVIDLSFSLFEDIENLEIGISITNIYGVPLMGCVNIWDGGNQKYHKGMNQIECILPSVFLLPNTYHISAWLKRQSEKVDDEIENAIHFEIIDFFNSQSSTYFHQYKHLNTYKKGIWKTINAGN